MTIENLNEHEARKNILTAAKREFAKKGFQGARMANIARIAGVNKALIHYYFKNKDNLYMEILERNLGASDLNYEIPIYMGETNLTVSQKIYIITYIIVMSYLKASDNELSDILLWEIAEGGEFLKKVHDKYFLPRLHIVKKLFLRGIETGEFETKYPDLIFMGLNAMIMSFRIEIQRKFKPTLFKIENGDIAEDDYLNFFMEYIFKMLRPKGKSVDIPKVPDDIIGYIDKLIEIIKDKGVSSELIEQFIKILGA